MKTSKSFTSITDFVQKTSDTRFSRQKELPLEIVCYIIEFVDNIDTRIAFNIFHKIDINKYSCLNSITRSVAKEYLCWTKGTNFRKYILQNLCENPNRTIPNINNDFIGITISIDKDHVTTHFELNRLKLKTNEKMKENEASHHNKTGLDDYYWDCIYYTHINL